MGIKGDLGAEQVEALRSAGIASGDFRLISGGYGDFPIEWTTLRTCVQVSAADESEARADVARALGVDASDLLTFSAEVFR